MFSAFFHDPVSICDEKISYPPIVSCPSEEKNNFFPSEENEGDNSLQGVLMAAGSIFGSIHGEVTDPLLLYQRSTPPKPPLRSEAKINSNPSFESAGCASKKTGLFK